MRLSFWLPLYTVIEKGLVRGYVNPDRIVGVQSFSFVTVPKAKALDSIIEKGLVRGYVNPDRIVGVQSFSFGTVPKAKALDSINR